MSDLSALFDKDPLSLTRDDISAIIKRMRENQAQYELGGKPVAAPKPAAAKKPSKTMDLLKSLGLDK